MLALIDFLVLIALLLHAQQVRRRRRGVRSDVRLQRLYERVILLPVLLSLPFSAIFYFGKGRGLFLLVGPAAGFLIGLAAAILLALGRAIVNLLKK